MKDLLDLSAPASASHAAAPCARPVPASPPHAPALPLSRRRPWLPVSFVSCRRACPPAASAASRALRSAASSCCTASLARSARLNRSRASWATRCAASSADRSRASCWRASSRARSASARAEGAPVSLAVRSTPSRALCSRASWAWASLAMRSAASRAARSGRARQWRPDLLEGRAMPVYGRLGHARGCGGQSIRDGSRRSGPAPSLPPSPNRSRRRTVPRRRTAFSAPGFSRKRVRSLRPQAPPGASRDHRCRNSRCAPRGRDKNSRARRRPPPRCRARSRRRPPSPGRSGRRHPRRRDSRSGSRSRRCPPAAPSTCRTAEFSTGPSMIMPLPNVSSAYRTAPCRPAPPGASRNRRPLQSQSIAAATSR